jgi:hypothetical protein
MFSTIVFNGFLAIKGCKSNYISKQFLITCVSLAYVDKEFKNSHYKILYWQKKAWINNTGNICHYKNKYLSWKESIFYDGIYFIPIINPHHFIRKYLW